MAAAKKSSKSAPVDVSLTRRDEVPLDFPRAWIEFADPTDAAQIFNSGPLLPVRVIGVICCFIYVFRDNLAKR